MATVIYDIETNGLLETLTKIHCLSTLDVDSGEERVYLHPESLAVLEAGGTLGAFPVHGDIRAGVEYLQAANRIIGHSILGFDNRVIRKLYGVDLTVQRSRDTKVLSMMLFPHMKELDKLRCKRDPAFPARLIGDHTLESWGFRIRTQYKTAKRTDWSKFDHDMLAYNQQDNRVCLTLWKHFNEKPLPERAVELEQRFAEIMIEMEAHGFLFDSAAVAPLIAELQKERLALGDHLAKIFPPKVTTHVSPVKKKVRVVTEPFKASSTHHRIRVLKDLYGWVPRKNQYTEGGQPRTDEDVLSELTHWAGVPEMLAYMVVQKRLSQIAEGKKSNWLKCVKADGRIHGAVLPTGSRTGRCAHFAPNIGQVPKVCEVCKTTPCRQYNPTDGKDHTPFGFECRSLFKAPPGFLIVGADASGLQLRMLAHYMARYDNGDYANIILNGDIHTANQKAAGLETRNQAKTFIYAMLFGAGAGRLGSIAGKSPRHGMQLKARFIENLPALKRVVKDLNKAFKTRKGINGLDGRFIPINSAHVALCYLCQGAEAVVMKQATVHLFDNLTAAGYVRGRDYSFVAHVHDEFQIEARAEIAHRVGELAVQAIRQSGETLGLRIRLDGEFKVGANWAGTH